VRVAVNCTFLGVAEGNVSDYSVSEHPVLNFMRLNLTVSVATNETYSIANMTYNILGGNLGGGVWWYAYRNILNFVTEMGTIYTLRITYELYFPEAIE